MVVDYYFEVVGFEVEHHILVVVRFGLEGMVELEDMVERDKVELDTKNRSNTIFNLKLLVELVDMVELEDMVGSSQLLVEDKVERDKVVQDMAELEDMVELLHLEYLNDLFLPG